MISTKHLCQHLTTMLNIPVRLYDPDGSLVDLGRSEENSGDPLVFDQAFKDNLLSIANEESPSLYYEAGSIVYAVIPANGERTIIMGPACYDDDIASASKACALLHFIDHPDSYSVTGLDLNLFAEAALLLFHSHSDKELSMESLISSSTESDHIRDARSAAYSIIYHNRENNTGHNSYAQEVREQKAIREGNIEALKQSWTEVQTGKIGRLGKDELTHFRSLAIVILTLASRSAIKGGVLPEVAFSLADTYTMKVHETTDIPELMKMIRSAEVHYAELVKAASESKSDNAYIRRCKELIHDRLHERVYSDELAEELGITRSYLSQLFLKEEGMHLSEYIIRQKVKSSEYLLIYPDIPLGTIAATFGFASQSHYGQAFKRYTGMTPGKYREMYLKNK